MELKILMLREYYKLATITQRELASILDVSLGSVNRLVAECVKDGWLVKGEAGYCLSEAGLSILQEHKVDAAVIIAAGFGSRFVPLTFDTPKGLLKVYGVPMIERQIMQLLEVGITDITIVVGYLKEAFDYLIDKYQVKLLYNPEFATKNTIATLYHAKACFMGKNVYLLSSDNWLRENMYQSYEARAWYSGVFMHGNTKEWCLTYNKKGVITNVHVGGSDSYVMYGPAFFTKEFSADFFPLLEKAYQTPGSEDFYWEQVFLDSLSNGKGLLMYINKQPDEQVYEFENLEELREFDEAYHHTSNNEAMRLIAKVFGVPESYIRDIRCLKAGMTNKSFIFKNSALAEDVHFICRIPGKGTNHLINRAEEASCYEAIRDLGLSENLVYFDPKSGYKISKYYENSKNADFENLDELSSCMERLRYLHHSGICVEHSFLIGERIDFFENLCGGHIPFQDYEAVRGKMNELLGYLDKIPREKVLCHIDSVCDNFLLVRDGNSTKIKLIDWEYAGMADPLIDIAMCAIYSYFDKEKADRLMDVYLQRDATANEWFIYYSYMALGGFLWTLWAVYKSNLGETYGEYTLKMYRYAKDCYRWAMDVKSCE